MSAQPIRWPPEQLATVVSEDSKEAELEEPRPDSIKTVTSVDKALASRPRLVGRQGLPGGDGEPRPATRWRVASEDSLDAKRPSLPPLPSDDGATPVSVRTYRSVSPPLAARPSFAVRVTGSTLSPPGLERMSSQRARYPMHGMPVARLLKMRGPLRRHEACLKSGLVTRIPPRAPVIFVSHQWLSFAHPDPKCIQLRRLQAMLRRVVVDRDASLFTEDDWSAFARGRGRRGSSAGGVPLGPASSASSTGVTAPPAGVDARKTKSRAHACAMRTDTRELTWDGFCGEFAGAYVWLDYFSIPQRDGQKFPRRHVLEAARRSSLSEDGESPRSARSSASPTRPTVSERHLPRTMSTQKAAIVSIPAYVERTHYFVILAPRATHEDTGAVCDLESWRSRGWCRLEEWSNFLTIQKSNPLVLTEHPRVHVEEMADFWSFRANTRLGSVATGAFTHAEDRGYCLAILKEMWCAKLEHYADTSRMVTALYGVLESKLFVAAPLDAPLSLPAARAAFASVTDYDPYRASRDGALADADKWDRVSADDYLGRPRDPGHPMGPGIVAAMIGDATLLRQALAEPGAVFERHRATGATTVMHCAGAGSVAGVHLCCDLAEAGGRPDFVDAGSGKLNITPLDRAVRCGHEAVVAALLARGADVAVRRSNGDTPLHAAAEMGRLAIARRLLDAGADTDAKNDDGAGPAHLAASDFTLMGSQKGKAEVYALLAYRGADLDVPDAAGRTAADVFRQTNAARRRWDQSLHETSPQCSPGCTVM